MDMQTGVAEMAGQGFDLGLWLLGGAILLLLVVSAFFSGSETALTGASRAKLHAAAEKGRRAAATALRLREDGERLIGSILLGNNIANILATSLATVFFTALVGQSGVAVATFAMTALVVVFAEIAPKTYAITNAERASMLVAPLIGFVTRIFAPIVGGVTIFVRAFLRIFGVRTDPDAHVLAHEEIASAISMHAAEGAVEKVDRDRLLAALDLRHRLVEEVMMHRSQIFTVSADDPPEEIVSQCLSAPYTRIPIWQREPENIVGVVHAKDLLRAVGRIGQAGEDNAAELGAVDITKIAMEPWFVPETTTLDDQLRAFLRERAHFALVVDEYGALQGLITLEDILEEIVGEITDEHDVSTPHLEPESDGSYVLDGAMTIRDINRAFDWSLPDEEANTIAGLVIHEAQTIPDAGRIFSFHGFRFEVVEREKNRVTQIRVRPLEQ
ncbi:MAG: HlyC/CorC family transporter [Pseudomonadota bacterium]